MSLARRYRQKNGAKDIKSREYIEGNKKENNLSKFKNMIYRVLIKHIGALTFLKKRMLNFKSSVHYDLVISLSSPAISHEIVAELIKKGNVLTKHSCQIWEDPWATDLYGGFDEDLLECERKTLALAEKILYVTPLTLENQKKLFPEVADKMEWLPLPSYIEDDLKYEEHEIKTYGYFGQYYPHVRNLRPLYEALRASSRNGIFCGEPSDLFEDTALIEINPRLSLAELAVKESQTDVLVCVANLGGGQIPGKIYQYSASVKPILFILDGTENEQKVIRNYFSKFERYVFACNNMEDILSAMEEIEKKWRLYERVEYFYAENICQQIIELVIGRG